MKMMEIESRLRTLLDACNGLIPSNELDDLRDLVRAGEPGVALEIFSDKLYDQEVVVEDRILAEIAELGLAMGLEERYWTCFRSS